MLGQVKWSVAAVLAGLLAAPVLGQPLRLDVVDQLQQGIDTPLLLAAPSVRKEIKLTDEQARKIHKIVKESYDKNRRQVTKAAQAARDNVNKAIPDILNADQIKRLHQVQLQVNGIVPFMQPEVQKQLKLTDKQKEEMQAISDDLKKDIRNTIQSAANLKERAEAIRKVPSLRKEAVQKAVAKLSDEQKKSWNEMTGEKFELPLDMLRSSVLP